MIISRLRNNSALFNQNLSIIKIPQPLLWTSAWFLLLSATLLTRPYFPVDETRYLSVAWEMWVHKHWFVPHLNGELYAHKPPLLFWLVHLSWLLFGVNEWSPRIIISLFSLSNLWLTAYLAKLLWHQQPAVALHATWIVLSSLLWAVFTTAFMFDMLVTFFTLLSMIALIQSARQKPRWGLLSVAIGLGILAKGPIILLHVLPTALAVRWWQVVDTGCDRNNCKKWYMRLFISTSLGILLALIWVIPASIIGGTAYEKAILWQQTAERVTHSFAHPHPVWWYITLLPIILFPWILWSPTWRGLVKIPAHFSETGVRFCGIWFLSTFVSLSLISGKQAHYLLPIFPAFALLLSYLLSTLPASHLYRRWDNIGVASIIVSMGILMMFIPILPHTFSFLPSWTIHFNIFLGGGLTVVGSLLIYKPQGQLPLLKFSGLIIFSIILASINFSKAIAPQYDLKPVSQYIADKQQAGFAIAHVGGYQGQYHFLGRITHRFSIIQEDGNFCSWVLKRPKSKLIVYFRNEAMDASPIMEYMQPYRGQYVGIMSGITGCIAQFFHIASQRQVYRFIELYYLSST